MPGFVGFIKEIVDSMPLMKRATKGLEQNFKTLGKNLNLLFEKRFAYTNPKTGRSYSFRQTTDSLGREKWYQNVGGKDRPTPAALVDRLREKYTDISGGFGKSKVGQLVKAPFQMAASPITGIVNASKRFVEGIGSTDKVKGMAKAGQIFGRITEKITGIPAAKTGAAVKAFAGIAKMGIQGAIIGGVMDLFMRLLDAINPFKPLIDALVGIFSVYGAILSQAFIPLIMKLYEVMLSPAVLEMFQALTDALLRVVVAFLPLIDIISPFAALLLLGLIIPLQILAPIIELMAYPLQILGTAMSNLTGYLYNVYYAWETYVKPWGEGIADFFKGIINAIFGSINKAIRWINDNIIPGDKYDLNEIPMLASGGIVTRPTLAVVGEKGPEAVIPLNGSGGGVSNVSYNITIGKMNRENFMELKEELWYRSIATNKM